MDESIHQPHDKLFKSTFSDPGTATAFLKWRLSPRIAQAVDWESLALEPGTFVDSHLRLSESDLLFSARIGGSPCYLYFLAEHISSPERFIHVKLLRYQLRVYEAQIAAAKAGNPAGMLALRLLKAARLGELLADAVWDDALMREVPPEAFETMLRYILGADLDRRGFSDRLERLRSPLRNTAMTLAQQLIEEGRQEGRQEGLAEGDHGGSGTASRPGAARPA